MLLLRLCCVVLMLVSVFLQRSYAITEFLGLEVVSQTGDHLGYGGAVFSADKEHVLACAYSHNAGQGKCYVFSETNPGDQDWDRNIHGITQSDPTGNDYFGQNGAVFSYNSEHILVCSSSHNDATGKCYVFSETTIGDRDWGTNEAGIIQSDPTVGYAKNQLGRDGFRFSSDAQHVLACADRHENQGKCYVWSESQPGDRNWNDTEDWLVALDGTTNDYLGYGGAIFSPDDQNVLACSYTHNSGQGKCYVFFETNPGDQNWGTNQIGLTQSSPTGFDSFGQYRGIFSSNSQHVLVCAYNSNSAQGRCYVFSETLLGNQDWSVEEGLAHTDPEDGDNLGVFGPYMFSSDDQHILVCAAYRNSFQGACFIFSESNPGNQDWGTNQVAIVQNDPTGADRFGWNGAVFSSDDLYVLACAHRYDADKGKCYVFWESTPGAKDWNANQMGLTPYDASAAETLGNRGGATFTSDTTHMITCAYQYNGNVTNGGKCFVYNGPWNQCNSSPCGGNGDCFDIGPFDLNCICHDGFEGAFCEEDVDDCLPLNPCFNDGICIDGSNSFNCSCPAGFTGDLCQTDVDDCLPVNPCFNDGICIDGSNSFSCSCPAGFTGDLCQTDVDDCLPVNPCFNHGNCSDDGSVPNSFNCSCPTGFLGDLCETNVDDCLPLNPCFNDGICIDGSNSFSCSCPAGFTGDLCQTDVDDCLPVNPCFNDGNCTNDGSVPNSFTCSCSSAYSGALCEINNCDTDANLCLNDGVCIIEGGEMECECPLGTTGAYCDEHCSSYCENNATCIANGTVAMLCTCLSGYTGDLCQEDIDDCVFNPCDSTGTSRCTDLGANLYECKCNAGWQGAHCEIALPLQSGNSFEIYVELSPDDDPADFAVQLQLELENDFPDYLLWIVPQGDPSDGITEFSIFWFDESGNEVEKPSSEKIAEVIEQSTYRGIVQYDATGEESSAGQTTTGGATAYLIISATLISVVL